MAKNMVNFYSQLECVNRYKYLGIHFCASGSFYFAQEELYKKAIKVYFKFSKTYCHWIQQSRQVCMFSIILLNQFSCMAVKCGACLIHSPIRLGTLYWTLVEFLTNFLQKNCIKSSVNIYLGFTQKQAIQLCCQNWVDSPYIST